MFNEKELRVAIATDSMPAFGGADRLLYSLLDIFPKSEVFTTVYNKSKYNIRNKVYTSFIQKIPFIKRMLSFLYPFSFELFDFTNYDFVITLTAGPAKSIITQVNQPLVTFVLTPPRHLWEKEINVRGSILSPIYRLGSKIVSHYMRIADLSATRRMGKVITISNHIKWKTKKIYGLDSEVIYPGVSKFWYESPTKREKESVKSKYNLPDEFVIYYGRLFDHKRVDWAIQACHDSKTKLIIIGNGPDLGYLKRYSNNSEYIKFLGHLNDTELRAIISLASVFAFPALEDFGYVTVEALAQGTPAFVFNRGGSIEIVKKGITGEYFEEIDELTRLISKKAWKGYNREEIRKESRRFTYEIFKKEILRVVKEEYEKYR